MSSSSIICEGSGSGDQFQRRATQGGVAMASTVAPLAQTKAAAAAATEGGRGGQFQPICLASNAFISGQQASLGCLILKCSPSQITHYAVTMQDQSCARERLRDVKSDYLKLLLEDFAPKKNKK